MGSGEIKAEGIIHFRRERLPVLVFGVFLPLFVFGILASVVETHGEFPFDTPILNFLHAHASPTLDRVMLFLSWLGLPFGVTPINIVIGIILLVRHRQQFLFWLAAEGGAELWNDSMKIVFHRARPALWVSIAPETTFSFPSGHAMDSMAFIAGCAVLAWPTRARWPVIALGGLFTFLVGVSRVYLGVHYPSDVLAGWALSLAWVVFLRLVLFREIPAPSEPAPVPAAPVTEAK